MTLPPRSERSQLNPLYLLLAALPILSFGQTPTALSSPKKPGPPPPLQCDLSPATVVPGGTVTIKVSPPRTGLYYAFGASAGTLVVTGDSALLNTSGVSDKDFPITVFCSAVGPDGQTVRLSVDEEKPPIPATMSVKPVYTAPAPPAVGYSRSAAIAPTLSWTTGTQTQTIAGGNALVSAVHSSSYCDANMRQFGLTANASDTSTTKLTGVTTNLDNNEVKLNATRAILGRFDKDEVALFKRRNAANPLKIWMPQKYARGYLGLDAGFFGNNSLGVGLEQAYTAQFQFYLSKCREKETDEMKPAGKGGSGDAPGTKNNPKSPAPRFFSSVGVGAGFMNQRLYATANKLNAAILPLSAQVSYLQGNSIGIPPKLIWYGLIGYVPVLTNLHAYQVGATAGLVIPTKIPWMTVNLAETDLYLNNAPKGFKRNYQNGSIALTFTFPPPPAKTPNPALPQSSRGACYGGDKLARLYCYDDVTADACSPPNLFRVQQHCASAATGVSVPAAIQLNQQ